MVETIILAAGQSSRMGSDKALLDINGLPAIVHIINKIRHLSDHVYIVLGDNLNNVKQAVLDSYGNSADIIFIHNDIHLEGMFSSVQKGFESVNDGKAVMLQLIDQPLIPDHIYDELVSQYDKSFLITQPSFIRNKVKRSGHPLIFAPEFKKIVLSYARNSKLNQIVKNNNQSRKFIEFRDDSILHNLNTKKEFNDKVTGE